MPPADSEVVLDRDRSSVFMLVRVVFRAEEMVLLILEMELTTTAT